MESFLRRATRRQEGSPRERRCRLSALLEGPNRSSRASAVRTECCARPTARRTSTLTLPQAQGGAERTAYSQEKKAGAGPQNEATRIRAKPSEAGRKANAPALL